MSEAWAVVIAAVVGAIGTIIATKLDDVVDLFRGSSRQIAGEWKGWLRTVDTGPESYYAFEGEYSARMRQAGRKVRARVVETRVSEGFDCDRYFWQGRVVGDYLILEGYSNRPEEMMVLSGTLHISPSGRRLRGHLVGNSGSRVPARTWVGYTELEKVG
jgi:hypothetical protein